MLIQIVQHTPRWVFALFAVLLWLGIQQLFSRRVRLTRLIFSGLGLAAFSLYGVASSFGERSELLLLWIAVAVAVAAWICGGAAPQATRYDPLSRRFDVPGSAVPLALMMGTFFTKYVVGVTLALHPELASEAAFALPMTGVYALFGGLFMGRSVRLIRLAMRSESAAQAGAPGAPLV